MENPGSTNRLSCASSHRKMIMMTQHRTHNESAASSARSRLAALLGRMRGMGPYVLIELIVPGGTLLALSLFLYRRWYSRLGPAADVTAAHPACELCAAALFIGALIAIGRFCGAKQPSTAYRWHKSPSAVHSVDAGLTVSTHRARAAENIRLA
jgi:hypothetical protein